jgi:hypothetical protein
MFCRFQEMILLFAPDPFQFGTARGGIGDRSMLTQQAVNPQPKSVASSAADTLEN